MPHASAPDYSRKRPSPSATRAGANASGSVRVPRPLEQAGEIVDGKFMGVDAPLASARFAVLPLPYEKTTSYKKGTARGPEKFIEGSLGVELFDEELGTQTYLRGIHTLPAVDCADDAPVLFPRIETQARELAKRRDLTAFYIGGEHSLSHATIAPYADLYPDLSIFHFDAHADLRPEYDGSPYNHACALYPISRRCRVVQTGIRSIAEEEAHFCNAGNVITYTAHDNRDVSKLIPKVLKNLSDTVYVTIDLDGFDPNVVPGVGTPQPGGYSWYDGLDLFRAVCRAKRVVGVDIMELCPLEDSVESEITAAKLAYRLMGYIASRDARR